MSFEPPPGFDGELRREDSSSRAKWTLGALLSLVVVLLLGALACSNLTAEGPAKRSIARSLAILTEVDAFLDAEYEDLRERAAATNDDVALTDFPVQVFLTPEEVLATDRATFRELLLSRSAGRIYDDGAALLREDREDESGFFSTEGLLRRGIDVLRPGPHRVFFGLTIALAVIATGLALGLASVTRGTGRLLSVAASVLVASLPFLAFAVGVRFAFPGGS